MFDSGGVGEGERDEPLLIYDILLVLLNPDNLVGLQLLLDDEVVRLGGDHALAEHLAVADDEAVSLCPAFRLCAHGLDSEDLYDGVRESIGGPIVLEEY